MDKPTPTVLFDIDGTLVDTTYLHVLAWHRAFRDGGKDVAGARIHRMIGVGADLLIHELIGEKRPDIKEAWRRHFDELKPEITAFPRAGELLCTLADRGIRVVLASSSEKEDLDALLAAIDANDAIETVTSAGDVEEAKPSPEVFQVALDQMGSDPATAIVVGDTPWDVEAAGRCGLACACVLTGGIARHDLEQAGAVAVYRDVADVLDHLDESPLVRHRPRSS